MPQKRSFLAAIQSEATDWVDGVKDMGMERLAYLGNFVSFCRETIVWLFWKLPRCQQTNSGEDQRMSK